MTNKHWLLCILLAVCLFTACNQSLTVYYHYEDTLESGWEQYNQLTFDTDKLADDATYQEEVALRINNRYPYMQVRLIVQQTVYPSGLTTTDMLDCDLIDEHGNAMGQGVSQYQYI